MKRYGDIYKKIYTTRNLKEAHAKARADKTHYKDVRMVDEDPERYLAKIQKMLIEKSYQVSQYNISTINDKGKEREIWKLPYFPDRIIQWAIMLQTEKIFTKTFCHHTCASLKGRGIKQALGLVTKYLKDKDGTRYCLKIDVSKFYPNINHEILKRLLRKKLKDPDLLWLFDTIIDSYPGKKGVPIGSYLSQYLANFYLAYFDHWLKESCGARYCVRYMDDYVIFHTSKEWLHVLLRKIKTYLSRELDLVLKPNYQVFPVDARGVDFVGYRFFHEYILLRKGTLWRFKRLCLRIMEKQDAGEPPNQKEWAGVNSYVGWIMWCDSYRLYDKYINPILPSMAWFYYGDSRKDYSWYLARLQEKKGGAA